jgi:hypothetical protein
VRRHDLVNGRRNVKGGIHGEGHDLCHEDSLFV